jgi:ATPase subunit of ABC transporter with duplicated ATPase domains
MTALLTLDRVAAATPDGRRLFDDLTLTIGRERTGLVGRNGAGKSTLLRLMAGEAEPAAGSIARNGRAGILRQLPAERSGSAAEALGVADALACLARVTAGDGNADDLAAADWTLEDRLAAVLAEVGLPGLDTARPLAGFSGGERTRIAIARLLLARPDLLLLDEPTNNLDEAGRRAIADLVAGWPGGLVVASHDRALLEGMDRIVELSRTGVTLVGGGWSAFAGQREAARERAATELDRARQALRGTQRAVQQEAERRARREKAGKALRASGSHGPMLMDFRKENAEQNAGRGRRVAGRLVEAAEERLQAADRQVERLVPLRIDLPSTGLPAGREVLAFDSVVVARGSRRLFGPLSFTLTGPERVAVTGANGAGKSTLLALAAGRHPPAAGTVRRGGAVALLDQQAGDLDPEAGVLDNLHRLVPGLSDNAARAALARFAFRGDQALVRVGALSGGERLRAALACCLSSPRPPALLMLDEPTNHLDLDSIEVLEAALRGFDGALLVVSHDPGFLEAVGVERRVEL